LTDTVIDVDKLGKRYQIRHETVLRYRSLRRELSESLRRIARFGRAGSSAPADSSLEEFWALRDVSFEIKQGEVIGIIGRNGAGKSTLLKILSRITEPTEGRARISGRVASLLEVGTGFHPELTGRENIMLNGVILGMTRAEVRQRFDEIVAFADVEKFLDTPVKHYSSGMYVRLAFSVAAHLDPEILVVDEVLAVGDAAFQKKCLGKMRAVSASGRTVLFVSHQMATVQNLCQRGLLLSHGRVARSGPMPDVIRHYLAEAADVAKISLQKRGDREGTGALRFTGISFLDRKERPVRSFASGATAVFELCVENTQANALRSVRIGIGIDSEYAQRVLVLSTHLAERDFAELPLAANRVLVRIPRLALCPGRYSMTLYCSVNGEVADWIRDAGAFDVDEGDFYGGGRILPAGHGYVLMDHQFEYRAVGRSASASESGGSGE